MFGYNHICKLFRPYLKWMDLFLLICRNPHHVVQQIHGFSYRFLSLNQSIEICWFFQENLQETSAFHWKIHGLPCVSHRFAIDVPLRFGNLQPSPCRHARTSTSSARPWSRWSRRAASVCGLRWILWQGEGEVWPVAYQPFCRGRGRLGWLGWWWIFWTSNFVLHARNIRNLVPPEFQNNGRIDKFDVFAWLSHRNLWHWFNWTWGFNDPTISKRSSKQKHGGVKWFQYRLVARLVVGDDALPTGQLSGNRPHFPRLELVGDFARRTWRMMIPPTGHLGVETTNPLGTVA